MFTSSAVKSKNPVYLLLLFVAIRLTIGAMSGEALAQGGQSSTGAAPPSQQATSAEDSAAKPRYREYRGVKLGMSPGEVRQKLGTPRESRPDEDGFILNDKEVAQVFYDADKKVRAISVTYMNAGEKAPSPFSILGVEVQPSSDGSLHKLIRYPEEGYWVSYNRSPGAAPVVTVTMQRIERQPGKQ
jgi:hypothetical protein